MVRKLCNFCASQRRAFGSPTHRGRGDVRDLFPAGLYATLYVNGAESMSHNVPGVRRTAAISGVRRISRRSGAAAWRPATRAYPRTEQCLRTLQRLTGGHRSAMRLSASATCVERRRSLGWHFGCVLRGTSRRMPIGDRSAQATNWRPDVARRTSSVKRARSNSPFSMIAVT